MLSRSKRFLLVPVTACLILTAASTFAGGSPSSPPEIDRTAPRTIKREKESDKETELPRAERMMEGLHKRMIGLRWLRHDAVKRGDVETVRKVDDAIEGMVKSLDGSFPELMRTVEEHEAEATKITPGRDKRTDGMDRRSGGGKQTTDDMRKRMMEKRRDKLERRDDQSKSDDRPSKSGD